MMTARKKIILIIYLLGNILNASGNLNGLVQDASTQQPLIGVNVIIPKVEKGAATDMEGHFIIQNVPVGSYTVTVSMIGYESVSRANVHIVSGRSTVANFSLNQQVLQGEGVEVTATFFEKTKNAVTSSRTVDIEEIRSDPVGAYDIMSMMQALPSVISGADQTNEIIVRGGSPGENLFLMDNLEIPYPNHYPEQGKGGGPITMMDTEFIERIDFFAGAFPAKFGEKLSSVMDITLRDGNREQREWQMDLNMAGFGLTFEGPLSENSSYLYSLKRSFLDFVISSSGLQAIPQYWSSQGKLSIDLTPTQKILVNFISGIDDIKIEGEKDPQLRGAENVDYSSRQATVGITYKNLFSKKGFFITSLGESWVRLNTDVYELSEQLKRNTYFHRNDLENELSFRSEVVYILPHHAEISGGINAKATWLDYDNWYENRPIKLYGYSLSVNEFPAFISSDEFYTTYFNNPNTTATVLDSIGTLDTLISNSLLDYRKFGGYFHLKVKPLTHLEFILGTRADYISYTKEMSISPRLGLKWHYSPVLNFNLAAGRYYQPPFNTYLNSKRGKTDQLKNYYADQIVGGIEYFAASDTRITLEYYIKEYADMVTFEMLEGSDGRDSLNWYNLVNEGNGRSRGIEFFVQKKYSNNWYGSFSWSHSISEGVDPRTQDYYPWDYDYRNVINLVGGYKIRYAQYEWYNGYKKSWVAKAFSWLPFMPSDEYEISVKYRYMGGRPYTLKKYDHLTRSWYVPSGESWNTQRFEPYMRIDLMLQQRFNYSRINLIAFWDIINIINRKNPWDYVYLDNGTKKMSWQYTTMPVGGMILEF